MAVTDKFKGLPKAERRGTRWRADWTENGKRRRKDFPTQAEAKDHEAAMVRRARAGSGVDSAAGSKLTVRQLNVVFTERMSSQGVRGNHPASPKTMDNYRRVFENYIEPRWGDTRLTRVSYDDTAEWIATLKGRDGSPAGASTRRAVAGAFGRLMNHAVRLRYLSANPTKDPVGDTDYVPSAKRQTAHVYLTMDQLLSLAQHAGEYADLVLVAGLCGLRWGEVTALQVQDVSLGSQPYLTVRRAYSEVSGQMVLKGTKTGAERLVPLPRWLASRLAVRVSEAAPDARVFSGARGSVLRNSKFTERHYSPAIAEAAAAASTDSPFPRPTFHDLRHTAVSLAIRSGANVKVVQQIAGHASATMTLDTYAGLFTDDLHDSASRLDDAITATLAHSSSLSRHWTNLDTSAGGAKTSSS